MTFPNDQAGGAPCPICGGLDYVWGRVGPAPNSPRLVFQPDGAGWADSPAPVSVRRCMGCGNVQMFAPNP